jgi:undecaprenyl pyrophosphate synthase
MVGDRSLFECKLENAGLAQTVTDFLEQTACLERACCGDELHVNILAPYDFLWEINQAIVDGRFCPERLAVHEAVDFVFRSGCFGRAALSGAIPYQAAFSKICLSPVYFPDCTVEQVERAIHAGGAPRFMSGL